MSGPLAHLSVERQRTLLRTSMVATAALLMVITVLGMPLRTGAAPLGIVSLQFAASPEAAGLMLASWAGVPRPRLLWAHGLDLVLPVAYAIAIALGAMRAARRGRAARRAARLASGAGVAAAVADQIENVAMGFTMLGTPGWPGVLVTLVAATIKSSLLVIAVGALLAASSAARRARAVVP